MIFGGTRAAVSSVVLSILIPLPGCLDLSFAAPLLLLYISFATFISLLSKSTLFTALHSSALITSSSGRKAHYSCRILTALAHF